MLPQTREQQVERQQMHLASEEQELDMAHARIERYHGEPAIMIDGVASPPMAFTPVQLNRTYLRRLGEAGIRLYFLMCRTSWNQPAGPGAADGNSQLLEDLQLVMEAVPDAWIMLRLDITPTSEWINERPGEQVLFNDGSREQVECSSAGPELLDGMISFASEAWRREGKTALLEFLAVLETSPYYERVVGFFLCGGGTGEWYYPGEHRMHNAEKGTYADFSEPFRGAYERFLRQKYGTEKELRRAWKRPDASFAAPLIPDMTDRHFVYGAEKEIARAYEQDVDYPQPSDEELNGTAPNVGVFLNANERLHTMDFYAALNEATAELILHFAAILKDYREDLLVGAFYGYYGCVDYFDASHSTGTLSILNSGRVDFLSGPGVYDNREPGGVTAQRGMQDSLRLRNQIYISEDDNRTHLKATDYERETMGLYTVQDSLNTLKREFARNLCEDIHAWWFDMSSPGQRPWYDDAEILALFRRQQELGHHAYSLDRTKKNEIAVIYDTESVHLVSDATDRMVLDYYRTSDLHRIGAPLDYYFHNDMALPEMPDYRLYILLNVYCLSDAEREAIRAKARRNHAVLLWMYAPGFVNCQAEKVMDTTNIERTTGMKVGRLERSAFPYFRITDINHPALRHADPHRRYGFIDRQVRSNIWLKPAAMPAPYVHPRFHIEEAGVSVLGRYCIDGRAAYALREEEGYTSAYCATPVLRNDLLASLAEYAGCHLYSLSGDVLYANEHCLALHAASPGRRRIRFKKPCSPWEVYEGHCYGRRVSEITVEMYPGETKMWFLEGEC